MKSIFIFSLCSLFLIQKSYSQDESEVQFIKMYAMPWEGKYCKPFRTIKNIRTTYLYYFETSGDIVEFKKMFLNYEDCVAKLVAQKELLSDSIKKMAVNVLVEFHFTNHKIVNVFFNNAGDYYFQDKWHIRNNGLYYTLFKYFSNEIISETILGEAKRNYIDEFWHSE